MKVGIIRCMQTEDYCPGTADFKAVREKTGVFAGVEEDFGRLEVSGITGVKVNERCDAVCFAVFIKRVGVMGSIQQKFFNIKPGKIGFHRKERMQERQHVMPGSAFEHEKDREVIV